MYQPIFLCDWFTLVNPQYVTLKSSAASRWCATICFAQGPSSEGRNDCTCETSCAGMQAHGCRLMRAAHTIAVTKKGIGVLSKHYTCELDMSYLYHVASPSQIVLLEVLATMLGHAQGKPGAGACFGIKFYLEWCEAKVVLSSVSCAPSLCMAFEDMLFSSAKSKPSV